MTTATHTITSVEELRALYGEAQERSVRKQLDRLDGHCRAFIAASPFLVLATGSGTGLDCSPKGDAPGFVAVADDTTLLIPDRRGNNRIDGLINVVHDPRVALIFFVPGVNETLRINGRAEISTDPALCQRFAVRGKAPKTVMVVHVQEAFVHCARALVRSDLWNPERFVERSCLPSMGEMLEAHTRGAVAASDYDSQFEQNLATTLY
jgi:PPOX class probable FMN-dependent enzyme